LFSTTLSSAILFSTVSPALQQLTSHTSCCKKVTCSGLWFWMRNNELISGQFLKQDMLESAAAKPKSDIQASTRWWLEQWKKSFNRELKLHKDNWGNQWGKWSSTKSANSSHLSCSQSASRSIIHFALHSHQSYIIQMTSRTQKIHHSGIVLHCCRKHCKLYRRCRLRLHSCKLTEEKQKWHHLCTFFTHLLEMSKSFY
jgi:hypothetical protein